MEWSSHKPVQILVYVELNFNILLHLFGSSHGINFKSGFFSLWIQIESKKDLRCRTSQHLCSNGTVVCFGAQLNFGCSHQPSNLFFLTGFGLLVRGSGYMCQCYTIHKRKGVQSLVQCLNSYRD